MLIIPQRSKTYIGPTTNSEIWSQFQLRPNDVIVSTPPKSGTTWMQSIILMLIFGKIGMDNEVDTISPWLDCGFRDNEAIAKPLDIQSHRRCIKSHTPFDGITYDPECTYIAVYRHPLDVHFSMRKHVENLKIDLLKDRFPESISEDFRMFVEDETPDGANDDMTLDSIVYHYLSFRNFTHLPNVHLYHYADMSENLKVNVSQLSSILEYDHPIDIIDQIVDGASFSTMQSNAKRTASGESATFKDEAAFFSSGTSQKWAGKLSETEVDAYDRRVAGLLSPEDVSWIEFGNTGQA
jgi:hypothetical protein